MSQLSHPFSRRFALPTLALLGSCLSAWANLVTLTGTLDATDPSYTVDGSYLPIALANGVHPYDLYSFQLSQAGTVTFTMSARSGGSTFPLIDPAVLIYSGEIALGSFSLTPTNYVGGNDDIVNSSQRNSLVSLPLNAGTTYTLVLTTWQSDLAAIQYGESQFGDYTATLDVTGATISPIPEPTTYGLLLGAATLGLVGWRRWRLAPAL